MLRSPQRCERGFRPRGEAGAALPAESHLDEGDGGGGALDVQQDGAHLRRHRQHAHGGST